ncbi:MAG: hypothetical protein ABIS86_11450 [Streptosporangiaceae bacterium]
MSFQVGAAEGDAAFGGVGVVVVDDLQAEGFVEGSLEVLGELVDLDVAERDQVEELGARPLQRRLLQLRQQGFLLVLLGFDLGGTAVGAGSHGLGGVVGEFEVGQEAFLGGLKDGEGAADGFDAGFVVGDGAFFGFGEQSAKVDAAVRVEDVGGEELGDGIGDVVLSEPVALGVPFGDVALGGGAAVVGGVPAGLAAEASPALGAGDVGAVDVGAFGVGVEGVELGVP